MRSLTTAQTESFIGLLIDFKSPWVSVLLPDYIIWIDYTGAGKITLFCYLSNRRHFCLAGYWTQSRRRSMSSIPSSETSKSHYFLYLFLINKEIPPRIPAMPCAGAWTKIFARNSIKHTSCEREAFFEFESMRNMLIFPWKLGEISANKIGDHTQVPIEFQTSFASW